MARRSKQTDDVSVVVKPRILTEKISNVREYKFTENHKCTINNRDIIGNKGDKITLNEFEALVLSEYIERI